MGPLLFAAGLLATLAGCETVSTVPAEDTYQPPPPGVAVVHLKGSSINEDGMFGSQHRGFVIMVDLKSVQDAADHWDEPVLLTPGHHTIAAEYRYSNFMTRAYIPFDAKAGGNYQLMIKSGQGEDGRRYNDFWIVDLAINQPVTPVYHRQVSGGKKGTLFNIPT